VTNADVFAGLVAQDLRGLEHSLDEALAKAGSMLLTLSEGRRRAGLGANVGQHALVSVGDTIAGVIAARGDIVKAHSRFARVADAMGLDYTTMGPLEDKHGDGSSETPPRPTGRQIQVPATV
jgi:hypothetical protein